MNLRLADFERDPSGAAQGPAQLEPSLLKSIAFTDIGALTGGETGPNTIWIGKLEALSEPSN